MQWLLPVVFRAVVFKLLVWFGAEGYVSGLQDAAASCKPAFYFHKLMDISYRYSTFKTSYFLQKS